MAADLPVSIRIKLLDAFSAPMRRMSESVKGIRADFQKLKGTFQLAGDMKLAADNVGAIGSALSGVLRGPFEEFKGFESQMSELAAISGEIGTEAFGKLREQASQLGADTSYSGTEAAAAMTELARAGRNATEIMAVTPTVLSLARASGMGLADAAETLGSAMNGMGLQASESTLAADVLAKTFTSASTSLGDLGEAFKMAAPLAKQSHVSIVDLSTAIGVLGNAGIRGTMAGTGLNGVILGLVAPTRASAKGLALMNIQGAKLKTLQTSLAKGDLAGALKQIGEASKKLPDAKRMEALEKVFGRESLKSASVLIDAALDEEGLKGWDKLNAKIRDSGGTANRMAAVMEDNLAGELERTGGAISELSLKLGEGLKPSIVGLAQDVQGLVGSLSAWVKENPELANTLLRLTAVTIGGTFAVKGIIMATSGLVSTYGVLRGAYLGVKTAVIISTGVTNGLAAAMYTALIPSFIQAKIAAFAASGPMKALTGTLVGKGGLFLAAAAAGYGIGRLISNAFDLDNKLSSALGWVLGKDVDHARVDKPGLEPGQDQTFGDGTVLDGKTGEVKKLGTGPASLAPKVVREGRAAGAMTADAMNARVTAAKAAAAAPATPGDPATKEQTKVLDQHQREALKVMKETRDELRKRRPTPAAAAPVGTPF